MKPKNLPEVLELNTKGQRNLSLKDLQSWYTEEELAAMTKKKYDENKTLPACDARFLESFERFKLDAKKINHAHRWTPEEDSFLRATYMYISDKTIALALNTPEYVVKTRRTVLQLIKGHITPIDVLVWCDRENFERDIKLNTLTKARPEIRDAIKVAKC